jgi:NADH-quinone oxidoreductase subunit A
MESTQISEFGAILLFLIGGALFVLVVLTVAKFVRPHRPNEQKLSPYECGEDAVGSPWTNFNVRFYIVALIFVLFEVEVVFLFPWAVVFDNEELQKQTNGWWGWITLVEMFIFIFLLAIGLAYAWAKGYLDWIRPKPITENIRSKVPFKLYQEFNERMEQTKTRIS